MIKIGEKQYKAEQTIEVHHDTSVPVQPVETGFNVQDHVRHEPLTAKIDILIYDSEESILHGRWEWVVRDGERTAVERTEIDPSQGTYDYLITLRDTADPFLLDCSDHAREASMIFPDMVISHIGQVVQKGGSYWCTVYFTQITKSVISTKDLYIQEIDDEGVINIRWHEESVKEPNVETLIAVPANTDMPEIQRIPIEAMPSSIKPGGLVNNIITWVQGLF